MYFQKRKVTKMFRKSETEMLKMEEEGGMVTATYDLLTDRMGFCDEGAPRELAEMSREAAKLLHEVMTVDDVKVNGNEQIREL